MIVISMCPHSMNEGSVLAVSYVRAFGVGAGGGGGGGVLIREKNSPAFSVDQPCEHCVNGKVIKVPSTRCSRRWCRASTGSLCKAEVRPFRRVVAHAHAVDDHHEICGSVETARVFARQAVEKSNKLLEAKILLCKKQDTRYAGGGQTIRAMSNMFSPLVLELLAMLESVCFLNTVDRHLAIGRFPYDSQQLIAEVWLNVCASIVTNLSCANERWTSGLIRRQNDT
jgi:hypothetical protein